VGIVTVKGNPLSPCVEQVRRADPDRYLTALYAAAETREDLFALYALNDELARALEVTDEPLVGAMRLQWWRDALDAASAGPVPRHPVAEAVARAQARRTWDADLVERLIASREHEFAQPPADLQALEAHVEATAGTLAALALGVLGVEDALTAEAARHVAIAYGLAGVLRSTAALARRRIVMLPANVMAEQRVTPGDILRRRSDRPVARVVASVAELAEAHVVAARQANRRVPARARPVLLWSAFAAADLATLRRAGYDPFNPAVARGSPFRRLAVAWRAAIWRGVETTAMVRGGSRPE